MNSKGKSLFAPVLAAFALAAAVAGLWIYVKLALGKGLILWLGTIPVFALHLGIIVFWCLFALVVWWIAERAIGPRDDGQSPESVQRLLVVASSFFVFLLGFIISQEWNNVNTVRREFSTAAAAVNSAIYKTDALPPSSRAGVRDAIEALARSISCDELPMIRQTGQADPKTEAALQSAYLSVTSLPPNVREQSVFSSLLGEMGTISEARRITIADAASGLPAIILITIFVVGGALLTLYVVQSAESRRGHLAMLIGVIVLVSIGTGMVTSLARPFAGAARVGAEVDRAAGWSYTECDRPSPSPSAKPA